MELAKKKVFKARMAEWSKAVDLRPTIVKMRGFEPLFVHIFYKIINSNTNFIT